MNKKEPNKNKMLTFWIRLRNCAYESELVLATQIRKGNIQTGSSMKPIFSSDAKVHAVFES